MSSTTKLLRLDSMTLRGIGSYYDGAELQFRPLTILCGKNGSGKSTWLNRISMLQRSLQKGKLPFSFDVEESINDVPNTNESVTLSTGKYLAGAAENDEPYGPLGTIGLHSIALEEGSIFKAETAFGSPPSNHPASQLLWSGALRKDAKFRLHLAHVAQQENTWEYCRKDLVELVFDKIYAIRMEIPWGYEYSDGPPPRPKYVLSCSPAFFAANSENNAKPVPIAKFDGDDGKVRDAESLLLDKSETELLLHACVRLIQSVLCHTLSGFFPISAIRDKQEMGRLRSAAATTELDDLIAELRQRQGERKSRLTTAAAAECMANGVNEPQGERKSPLTTAELSIGIRDCVNRMSFPERIIQRYVGEHGEASFALWRAFRESMMSDRFLAAEYPVGLFVYFWLDKLIHVRPKFGDCDFSVLDQRKPLRGCLQRSLAVHDPGDDDPDDLCQFTGPCFQFEQNPARLSSGFHQLMPLIMQAALLLRGEILAIENPEVHLHPSLQLEVAGFLMEQALSGKTVVIETHSDLIIRRLIRAVLEEEIPQEALNIQFISLKTVAEGVACSAMEPLWINGEGRIENWPEGFMDDDLKESRRLINIMYGIIPEKGETNEPNA